MRGPEKYTDCYILCAPNWVLPICLILNMHQLQDLFLSQGEDLQTKWFSKIMILQYFALDFSFKFSPATRGVLFGLYTGESNSPASLKTNLKCLQTCLLAELLYIMLQGLFIWPIYRRHAIDRAWTPHNTSYKHVNSYSVSRDN